MSTIIKWLKRLMGNKVICHRTVHFRQKGDNAPYDVKTYALSENSTTSSPTTCPTIIGSWQATPPVRTAGTFVWERIQHYNKDGVLTSTSYTRLTGDIGSSGAHGLWYEFAGVWGTGSGEIQSVTNTTNIGYYVKYNGNFYMNTKTDGANTTVPVTNGSVNTGWEQMASDRQFYIAKAFFGDYAQFGSAIINGDWIISKNGTINGVEFANGRDYSIGVPAYTLFDTLFPDGNGKSFYTVFGSDTWNVSNVTFTLTKGRSYKIAIKGHLNNYTALAGVLTDPNGNTISPSDTITGADGNEYGVEFSITSAKSGSYNMAINHVDTGKAPSMIIYYYTEYFMLFVTPTKAFVPAKAVNLLTGQEWLQEGNFRGTIYAKNLLTSISVITSNTYIHPDEYNHTYIIDNTNASSPTVLTLPTAELIPNAEIQVLLRKGVGKVSFIGTHLYVLNGGDYEDRYAHVSNFEDEYGNTSADDGLLTLKKGVIYTFKSYGGYWHLISNVVTKEKTTTITGDYTINLDDGDQFIFCKPTSSTNVNITLPAPTGYDGLELSFYHKKYDSETLIFVGANSANIIQYGDTLRNLVAVGSGRMCKLKAFGGIWYNLIA